MRMPDCRLGMRKPQHQFQVLNCLAGSTLAKVIENSANDSLLPVLVPEDVERETVAAVIFFRVY